MKIKDEDFSVFNDLVARYPDFRPKIFINAVIKHRFKRYFPLDDIPREEIFYIGFQALYQAWKLTAVEDDMQVFIQRAWKLISAEIYDFIKIEYQSSDAMKYLKKRTFISRVGEYNYNNVDIFDALSDHDAIENFYKKLQFNETVNALFKVCLNDKESVTSDIKLVKLYLCGFSAVEIAGMDSNFCNRQAVLNRLKTIFEKARVNLGIDPNLSLFLFNGWQNVRYRVGKENKEKINAGKREKRRRLRAIVLQPEFTAN